MPYLLPRAAAPRALHDELRGGKKCKEQLTTGGLEVLPGEKPRAPEDL
jgi:hypothetical protein